MDRESAVASLKSGGSCLRSWPVADCEQAQVSREVPLDESSELEDRIYCDSGEERQGI